MKRRIRLGVVGCGRVVERYYLPAMASLEDIDVIAAVDPVEARGKLVSSGFPNCAPYRSLDPDLIARMDAAVVTTPPDSHIPLAKELLKQGKSILVEKPLAPSMAGTEELKEAEVSSRGFIMMGFNYRYWDPVVELRERLSRGMKIESMEIVFAGDYRKWDPVSPAGDLLEDLGPHVVDLAPYLLNRKIRSVTAESAGGERLDMTLRMDDDIRVHCRMAHSREMKRSIRSDGNFYILGNSVRLWPEPGPIRRALDLADAVGTKILGRTFPVKRTFERQLERFLDAVRSGRPADPGFDDGIAAILALEAARKSMINAGKEVALHETR